MGFASYRDVDAFFFPFFLTEVTSFTASSSRENGCGNEKLIFSILNLLECYQPIVFPAFIGYYRKLSPFWPVKTPLSIVIKIDVLFRPIDNANNIETNGGEKERSLMNKTVKAIYTWPDITSSYRFIFFRRFYLNYIIFCSQGFLVIISFGESWL